MSKKIFAANWKLNKTPEETREFIIKFKNEIFKIDNFFIDQSTKNQQQSLVIDKIDF